MYFMDGSRGVQYMKKSNGCMSYYLWVTLIIFCLRCLLSNAKAITDFSLYDIYGYMGEAVLLTMIFVTLYDKIIWRYNPLGKTPVLYKKYSGTFVSDYDSVRRDASLEIEQTWSTVRVTFISGESRSDSVTASLEKVMGEWQLTYCYLNKPKAIVRNRSEIHYGTATLIVNDRNFLEGQYYTDRKTIGDMIFTPAQDQYKQI